MSTSPLAGVKVGVRFILDEELSISAREARRRVNDYFGEFEQSLQSGSRNRLSGQRDILIEEENGKVIFRGGDLVFDSNTVPIIIALSPIADISNILHEQNFDDIILDIEGISEDEFDEPKSTNVLEDIKEDLIVFSSPEGEIIGMDRPFIRTNLGIGVHDDIDILNKIDRSRIPESNGIIFVESEIFGNIAVLDTGETQIGGERLSEIVEDTDEDLGLIFVGIDQGRF